MRGTLANREPLRIGQRDSGLGFYGSIDEVRLLKRVLNETDVHEWFWSERIRGIIETPVANRSSLDSSTLLDYYINRFGDEKVQEARQRLKIATRAEKILRDAIPTVLVMQEMATPRITHILERGQYHKLGELVTPGVPTAIAPWPARTPENRLGFAKWLVSKKNPLTARVAVNRLWQQCFGDGLVRTVDDFGLQGEPPTHAELLDWLAVTFRESGWNVKALLKRIVMSKTYRQQSAIRVKTDPDNRLLARGPSGRLSAEMVRDQALAVSGLLVRKIGGPSVKPYQPAGLWKAVSYNGQDAYVPDTDEGLWRRSLYTYVKRQAPPPILLTFDGPTREKCTVRRARTNTPLQALLLLNDPTFVEAARVLADRTLATPGNDVGKIQHLWRRVLYRNANHQEVSLLQGLLNRQRERFTKNPDSA
ncbi:MAG: DUF1553 domain-containing protein [Planctomycetaceae bacterium]|nr:DUF1553 domain-containing protein [Planctomycetaceae bacterium]